MPRGIAEATARAPCTVMRTPTSKGEKPTVRSQALITIWRKPTSRKMGARATMRRIAFLPSVADAVPAVVGVAVARR